MEKKFLQKANLNIIHYANCWEDADVLMQALEPKSGSKILSIASAGDNSLALLSSDPEILIAIDLSQEQLYLTELKQIAIKNFERNEFLEFAGVIPGRNRIMMYDSISTSLSNKARGFWFQNQDAIRNGIIFSGKFEHYFLLFRKYILPLVHSKKVTEQLFSIKSPEQQLAFYNKNWNTRRWRWLFKIFFSKFVMGRFGRDPEFLKQVDINVEEFIFNMSEKHLSDINCQRNYFLSMIMRGEYRIRLPFYMREENYNVIKKNIEALHLQEGYVQDAVKGGEKFEYMNLSNIFEYMPESVFEDAAISLHSGMRPGGKLAYWNLMVERKMSRSLPGKFQFLPAAERLHKTDLGFFYRDFICEQCI